MKNIKKKKRYARIGGIAGLVSGLGTVILFSNPKGWLSVFIGGALMLWGFSNGKR